MKDSGKKNPKFVIPEPRIPTPKEMRGVALDWWKNLEPVAFTSYPRELYKHCIPYLVWKGTPYQNLKFMESIEAFHERGGGNLLKAIETLGNIRNIPTGDNLSPPTKIEGVIRHPFFVKLISRSPKDYLAEEGSGRPKPMYTAEDIINALVGSMRTMDDIGLLHHIPEHFALVYRPYLNWPDHQEWRVFVKGNRIMAITQYYHHIHFPKLTVDYVNWLKPRIVQFVQDNVIPYIPASDFVADVVDGYGHDIKLLETNPYGLSDPCLFRSYESIDGRSNAVMRFRNKPSPRRSGHGKGLSKGDRAQSEFDVVTL